MTKNLWTQHEHPIVEWGARLDGVGPSPERMLSLMQRIADAGTRTAMMLFHEDPIRRLREQLAVPAFLRLGLGEAAAHMCWFRR